MKFIERIALGIIVFIAVYDAHLFIVWFMKAHNWKGLDAGDWAAWVQGIGSIAAVYTALLVMNRQNENARKLAVEVEAKNVLRRLRVIQVFVEKAHEVAKKIEIHTEPIGNAWDYFFTTFRAEELHISIQTLKQIPLHSIDLPIVALNTQNTLYWMNEFIPLVEKFEEQNDVHYTFQGDDKGAVLYIFKHVEEARTAIADAIYEFEHTHLAI